MDRVYVGWRYDQAHPDPGPEPRPPYPYARNAPTWLEEAEQYQGETLRNRPLKYTAAGAGIGGLLFLVLGFGDLLQWAFALVGLLACLSIIGITGWAIWQGEQAMRIRRRADRQRREHAQARLEQRRAEAEDNYALARRQWEAARTAYENQPEWHPVTVPPGVDRVDIAGGTLAGWAAAVTMMGAAQLEAGSQVTVLDLSEGAVARDLLQLPGEDPLVWVLPADLERLDLGTRLGPSALADVLSLVVGATEAESSVRDTSIDNSILERLIAVLGGTPRIAQITAALRALAQVGDPRDDLKAGLLTEEQLDRITTLFGRGAADKVVLERAWTLESQLRKLEGLGTDAVHLPPAPLRVISLDRRAGVLTNKILATYVTTALTHLLRQTPAHRPWGRTLFLCGAEKLRGDVLDRLADACETTGTGLVLMYRTIPGHVRERLGRGNSAVGFMRLGNASDAAAAADYLGAEPHLLLAEATEKATPEEPTAPYSSTVAYARRAMGEHALTAPLTSPRPVRPALIDAISTGPWPGTVAGAAAPQRTRELRPERRQLQDLPPTAMVFTHANTTYLVDANPGIMTLPTAHPLTRGEDDGEPRGSVELPADDRPSETTDPS
ncbi:hypothetical protein ABGB12_27165 [Actinocorallia sp. B10E7]|uniref:hypothetical protein n=1 Tax=Actinocorallia sp. B10E7 TaxID=3153558 RepID=UPI00325D0638